MGNLDVHQDTLTLGFLINPVIVFWSVYHTVLKVLPSAVTFKCNPMDMVTFNKLIVRSPLKMF